MSPVNQSRNQTAFTVSIEAKRGVTTGISAHDRAKTIKNSFENKSIKRTWVHTCSLDHKNALNNYLSRGMKIFKKEIITI